MPKMTSTGVCLWLVWVCGLRFGFLDCARGLRSALGTATRRAEAAESELTAAEAEAKEANFAQEEASRGRDEKQANIASLTEEYEEELNHWEEEKGRLMQLMQDMTPRSQHRRSHLDDGIVPAREPPPSARIRPNPQAAGGAVTSGAGAGRLVVGMHF